MKPNTRLRAFLFLASSSLLAIPASHAGQIWDGGGADNNWSTVANWDANTLPNFNNAISFVGDTQNTTNNDRIAASIVGGINFTNDGSAGRTSAFILGGNSITLSNNITTTANVAGSTITDVINFGMIFNNNRVITTNQLSNTVQHNLTIGGLLSQDGTNRSLTKQGGGTLTLNGTVSNTFLGGLALNGGSMILDYSNMVTATNLVASPNTLAFRGSNLILRGKATGLTSQTFGNVSIAAGGNRLLIDPNGGTSTTLTLGTIDTVTSGTSVLLGKAPGAGSGDAIITTTTNKTATDIYRARFVYTDGSSNGYDWVTTSSVASPYTLSAYAGYAALEPATGTDTLNSRMTGSATLTGNRTTNTLKIENPGANQSLDLAGNTLTLTGGGLLVTGTNAFQISGSTGNRLTASNGAGSYDLIVHQYNTGGLDIGATIGNNGSNPVALVKDGTGALVLSASNVFTGGVFINSGELKLGHAGALNSTIGSENAVTFTNGSTLTLNGNSVVVRSLGNINTTDLNGSIIQNESANAATLTIGNSANTNSNFAGIIQDGAGGGALSLVKNGTGTLTLTSNNTFTGGIVLNAGGLNVTNNAQLGAATNIVVNGNSTFSGGSSTYARSFQVNGSSILNIGNETTTITGDITGTGGLSIGVGSGFSAGAIFNGTNNTFQGGVTIGGSGVGNANYRASFASLTDNSSANGNISFVGNAIAGTAFGSGFEYTGSTALTLDNRAIVLASTGSQPGHTSGNPGGGHQIRQNGSGTLTINTDLSVTSPYAQTLALRGSGNGVFGGDISNGANAVTGTTALGATFASGATSITLGSVDGIVLGASISGTGIAPGTTITGIDTLTRVVTLSLATTAAVPNGSVPTTVMTVAGVTNPVSVSKNDAGVWTLSGANTYSGATTVNAGILTFANRAAKSSNSTVTALAAGSVGLGVGAGGITDYSDSDVATLFNNGQLGGSTGINLAAGSGLAIDTSAGNFNQSTALTANRALTKLGDNTLTLSAANTYNGATSVRAGKLVVNGSISTSSLTTVSSGATIGGSGTTGALTIAAGGFVTPGNSAGMLTVNGNYTQAGLYTAEINGVTADMQHDQIAVNGAVNINGGSLTTMFSGSYVENALIFILLNDGSDGITGTFAGLSQGSTVATYDGFNWIISYVASSQSGTFTGGNDIALQAIAIPEPQTALLAVLGVVSLLRRRRAKS